MWLKIPKIVNKKITKNSDGKNYKEILMKKLQKILIKILWKNMKNGKQLRKGKISMENSTKKVLGSTILKRK